MRGFIELIAAKGEDDEPDTKIQVRIDTIIGIEDYSDDETKLYIASDGALDTIEVEEKYESVVTKMENEMEILNAFQR